MRSPAAVISSACPARGEASTRLLLHEGAYPLDGLLAFVEHRRERMPYVDHVLPGLVGHVDARFLGPLGQARRIVEQGLRGADLNEQRRQTREVRIDRRGQRRAGVFSPPVTLS